MRGEPLPTRPLGRTGLNVTTLGFGAASLGNLYRETTDDEALAAVDAAWERGIRYFDTAPHYGLGLSERRLGHALASRPRADYVLSTKVGRLLVPNQAPRGVDADFLVPDTLRRRWDFSRDGILRSLEESLERLSTDHVDMLYIHDPEQHDERSAWLAADILAELKAQGVIRARGVGTNSAAQLAELFAADAIDVAMLAGRYTLLEHDAAEPALAAAEQAGASLVAVGVFNSGLLSLPRPRADAHYNYAAAPRELIERANRIADVCEAHGCTLPQAAMAFPLRRAVVANVTLGMRTAEQVEQNANLFQAGLPAALWSDLATAGLASAPGL
jgi:D-threo-aldose 1-dehydrogenase